jgi:hypothetical protein
MKASEFEAILSQLTMQDLYHLQEELSRKFFSSPSLGSGDTKSVQIRHFTYWVKENPGHLNDIISMSNALIQKKAMAPVRGPVSGTHYIAWADFQKLHSYPELAQAITFEQSGSPVTRDGYVSVHAIYNMSAWENWKSSSLSAHDRALASAIGNLNLLALMRLNEGRRKDQPALFPENLLM